MSDCPHGEWVYAGKSQPWNIVWLCYECGLEQTQEEFDKLYPHPNDGPQQLLEFAS
jgi:hypothetical protein